MDPGLQMSMTMWLRSRPLRFKVPAKILPEVNFELSRPTSKLTSGSFSGLQRPKMATSLMSRMNPIFKRIILYIITLGHFLPLEPVKRKNYAVGQFRKSVFCIFQPTGGKNDPKS